LAAGIVLLVRLRITLSAPLLTLIGWIDVGPEAHRTIWDIAWSVLSALTLIAFGQVFNDIADRELDAEAKPHRPIPAGLVTVPQAWGVASVLVLVAIGAAVVTSVVTFLYAAFCLVLSVLYSARLKNTILLGNLTVAVVSCAMLTYGSSSVSSPWGPELAGTIVIFLYTLGNELYKTAMDAPEDAQYGLRTMATVHGLRVTARMVAVVASALLVTLAVVGITEFTPISFVIAATVVIGVPVVVGAVTVNAPQDVTVATFVRSHRYWRLAWLPGALAMLLLR
jgi:4-hydroxybenzoate polyprenyltransferase